MPRKPALQSVKRLREGERGSFAPLPSAGPRIALIYPNGYAVGMSSLGFQATLELMRRHGLAAERFFAGAGERSVDTDAAIGRFGILAFSVAYELDWLRVLEFLGTANIPLRAEERTARHPLIIAGGVCVSLNRAPVWPFIDVFAHGEAEALVPAMAEALRNESQSRGDLLRQLSAIPGVEISDGAARAHGLERVQGGKEGGGELPAAPPSVWVADLDAFPACTPVVSPGAEFSGMGLIDLARGCCHHCTFCWIGHSAPPYRTRSRGSVVSIAEGLLPLTDRLGLVASAVGAHPEIDAICADLLERGARISFSSLRAEDVTPGMLRALAASGQRTVTLAPEAGSDRLRRLLGKQADPEPFFRSMDLALSLGMRTIKMYFMTGLPTESEEEADEIVDFVERGRRLMLAAGRKKGALGELVVNLGLFAAKPNLPVLRAGPRADFPTAAKRLKRIARLLKRLPNVRVNPESPELAAAQEILSMGGSETSEFLLRTLEARGNWRAALRQWQKAGTRGARGNSLE